MYESLQVNNDRYSWHYDVFIETVSNLIEVCHTLGNIA